MSNQLHLKLAGRTVLALVLVQALFWRQEVDGQFMLSRFHQPRHHLEDHRLLREVKDVELPIYEHDKQRLKLVEAHKLDEHFGKVKRASKGSNCVLNPEGKVSSDGGDCSEVNSSLIVSDKPLPLDDIKRMILRVEAMLENLINSGYTD